MAKHISIVNYQLPQVSIVRILLTIFACFHFKAYFYYYFELSIVIYK